jgi:glycosyltransferase involved in cell wall biosynthesis
VSHIFVYRNCFTGDISGGDMHTGGVSHWISINHPEHPLFLVHAENDGQNGAYREMTELEDITYPDTSFSHPALMFLGRAGRGGRVSLPLHATSNIFIAGSHFLPDVWPVLKQGRYAPGALRGVYIHHIVQEMPRARSLNTALANAQERFCFSLIKNEFDIILTDTQDVIDGLRRRGFKQPILLSSNFVNSHSTRPVAYSKKDITLLFCGRLVPQKGIDDFLAVCEAVQAKIPGSKAVMIGAGPEEQRLRSIIASKKLQVELTGFVTETRKFELLSKAKLLVMPSIEEGWGIAIAESMSVGTPIVAYDLPAYEAPFGSQIHTVPLKNREQLTKEVLARLAQYERSPQSYTDEQQSLIQHASSFQQDTVAANEYTFVMEHVYDF